MTISNSSLINVFLDTEEWYTTDKELKEAVQISIEGTRLYMEGESPKYVAKAGAETMIEVNGMRSFQMAMELAKDYPKKKIAVHNFASATNPGGGVRKGSKAQEEALCRCSTLYAALSTEELWEKYYQYHRNRQNTLYTDACIYTPNVKIIKTDEALPQRIDRKDWLDVDILTCAAPNLRAQPYNIMNPGKGTPSHLSDPELLELHIKRGRHILSVAAANGADILVLGAFGCGTFCNKPEVVAKAYRQLIDEFDGVFERIAFAVYCTPRESKNYDVFKKVMSE